MNLKINHRLGIVNVQKFNNFSLNLKFDSMASTFGIEIYFDPENQQHAEMACVSHFHECIIEHNGKTVITGFILSQSFYQKDTKQLVSLGGYSKPGVLEDCEIPTNINGVEQSEYLQYDGLTLREIAQKIVGLFKLGLVVEGIAAADSNQAFTLDDKLDAKIEKITTHESKNIKSFLTDLAVQRNVILSHDVKGNLMFTEAKTHQKPLFHVENDVIATSIKMVFNGQAMHSQITVVRQPDSGGDENTDSNEFTIYNPYCPIVFRPHVVMQSSGDINTIEEFAKNILAQELKNIKFMIEIDRIEIDGKLILPNNVITILCPEIYIYEKATLFIEEVAMKGDQHSETAVLTCVLPEVYNRQYPKNIFIDAHLNFPRVFKRT